MNPSPYDHSNPKDHKKEAQNKKAKASFDKARKKRKKK